MNFPNPLAVMKLTVFIFHYDTNGSACLAEAASLCSRGIKVRVLVSWNNYRSMKELYEGLATRCGQKIEVRPLLFQDDDLTAWRRDAQPRQHRQPVEAGHGEIEQDEVGLELRRELERRGAVRRLADDVEAALRQQRRKGIAREGMVVDDEDSLRHVLLIGRSSAAD